MKIQARINPYIDVSRSDVHGDGDFSLSEISKLTILNYRWLRLFNSSVNDLSKAPGALLGV